MRDRSVWTSVNVFSFFAGWDRWGPKTFKTNEVVWDAIWTAMKPEKMFWTAEIELYRWVMSNGPCGYKKIAKMVSRFLEFGPLWRRRVVDSQNFDVFRAGMALKMQNSSSEINFGQKFHQKHFFCDSWQFLLVTAKFCFGDIFSILSILMILVSNVKSFGSPTPY